MAVAPTRPKIWAAVAVQYAKKWCDNLDANPGEKLPFDGVLLKCIPNSAVDTFDAMVETATRLRARGIPCILGFGNMLSERLVKPFGVHVWWDRAPWAWAAEVAPRCAALSDGVTWMDGEPYEPKGYTGKRYPPENDGMVYSTVRKAMQPLIDATHSVRLGIMPGVLPYVGYRILRDSRGAGMTFALSAATYTKVGDIDAVTEIRRQHGVAGTPWWPMFFANYLLDEPFQEAVGGLGVANVALWFRTKAAAGEPVDWHDDIWKIGTPGWKPWDRKV